jgi:periplasmic divalent cation tolerance protein
MPEQKESPMEALVVYITASTEDEAARIARTLVEAKLAGCVNIVRDIRSIYSWQGKIEDEKEVLMIVKTRLKLFNALRAKVLDMHSYSVPEIIAVPIVDGSEEYMKWLKDVTS